ncbi:MAG: DotU family type IV/VI secretion system protein [Desulfovibrio sp.]|jgi:type VI protein secretion system component VasF|nr:DotU family type IV/VI secretion system protein [Desulfovibrio sp.]
MPRTDWFNEAVITAMLAACAKDADTGARVAQGSAVTEVKPFMPSAGGQGARNAESPALKDVGPFMPSPGGQSARDAQGAAADDAGTLTQASNLRAHLLSLLDEARRLAVADGFPPEYAETADFAVCAFIDETLLSSGWNGRAEWMIRPLQLERHDTGTAGEDFYRLLDDLLEKAGNGSAPDLPAAGVLPGLARSPSAGGATSASRPATDVRERNATDQAQTDLLEIFALCLAQGFTGMYFHDPDTVSSYLRKIGQTAPSVSTGRPPADNSLFFPASGAPRTPASLLQRFDLLDWLLWLAPLGITAAIHHLCGSRLDGMLTGLLQRSTLP